MFKKALGIFACFQVIAVVLTSCCNCDDVQQFNFKWTGVSLSNYSYIINTDVQSAADTSTDYSTKNYALGAQLNYQLLAVSAPGVFSFYNSAYACKCALSQYHTEKQVLGISIKCLNGFDATHPMNSDVSMYFKDAAYSNGKFTGLVPRATIEQQPYFYNEPYEVFKLYLDKKPEFGGLHQFAVIITFTDNSTVSEMTTPVYLK